MPGFFYFRSTAAGPNSSTQRRTSIVIQIIQPGLPRPSTSYEAGPKARPFLIKELKLLFD